jgi:hypothetical protein
MSEAQKQEFTKGEVELQITLWRERAAAVAAAANALETQGALLRYQSRECKEKIEAFESLHKQIVVAEAQAAEASKRAAAPAEEPTP